MSPIEKQCGRNLVHGSILIEKWKMFHISLFLIFFSCLNFFLFQRLCVMTQYPILVKEDKLFTCLFEYFLKNSKCVNI